MKIRSAKEADIDKLAELEQEIFTDPWSKKSLRDTFFQQNTLILIVEHNESVKGYVIVYCVLDEGEIVRIAVSGEMRRKGAAASLLEETRQVCLRQDICRLLLEVRKQNLPAISLYERFGFIKDGIRKEFYQNPTEDAVLMSVNLS